MKVLCKQTTSKGFDLKQVTTVFSNDFDYTFGGYGLELGKQYLVMGIATYKDSNCQYYLLDVNGKPEWFPFLLFEISDNSLPQNWFVRISGEKESSDLFSIYGFEELCNDVFFYDRLAEREEVAMRIYFKRKIEYEEELDNSSY